MLKYCISHLEIIPVFGTFGLFPIWSISHLQGVIFKLAQNKYFSCSTWLTAVGGVPHLHHTLRDSNMSIILYCLL